MRGTTSTLTTRYVPLPISTTGNEDTTTEQGANFEGQNELFSNFGTSIKSSAGRLTRMAANSSRIQVLKLATMVTGGIILLWLIWGWIFH